MKKLSLLVTILVFMSSIQLCLAAEPTAAPTAKRDTAQEVDYKSTQTITYNQQEAVEIDKIRNNKEVVLVMDTSSEMSSYLPHEQSPFDSALFSGSKTDDLTLRYNQVKINGNVHSNSGITMTTNNSSTSNITGTLSAVNDISIPSSLLSSPGLHTNSPTPIVEMGDLSAYFKSEAADTMTMFSTKTDDRGKLLYENIFGVTSGYASFPKETGFTTGWLGCGFPSSPEGQWKISGEDLILLEDKPLFFDGNVELNNSKIRGNGIIIATGDIVINVGDIQGQIGIYSVNGDITLRTGESDLQGIIYAPHGDLICTLGELKLDGSIVTNNINTSGQIVDITYKMTDLHDDFFEAENILKHITVAKASANNFINKLAGYEASDIKMSVITYDDKAEILGPVDSNGDIDGDGFFNIKNETDGVQSADCKSLLESVNQIKVPTELVGSNLGDGLRKAYYMLKGSLDKKADKYIVVLSGSEPNKWTEGSVLGTFMEDPGDVWNPSKLISSIGEDGKTFKDQKAALYSQTIGEKIKESASPIKSFFIDVKGGGDLTGITGSNGIAESAGAVAYNPEADGGAYNYESMLQKNFVADIGDEILNDASYVNPLVTATFTDIIPMGVEVKDPSILVPTKLNEITTLKLNNAKINTIDKVGTTDKILGKIQDIIIKVKYNKKGQMVFPEGTIKYTITNPVTNATIDVKTVKISPITVDVGWLIDIN